MVKSIVVILLAGLALASCRSTKNIGTAISKKDTTAVTINPVHEPREDSLAVIREHFRQIQGNRIGFTTFTAKLDVDYRGTDGKKYDVNAHLRMYKDSVIWVSVTAILGIEGMRAYITRDSVKLLDKQNKIYIARSVSYLQELTALPLDLPSLQDLLLGNPVFLDSNIISFSRNANSISLLSAGDYFRNLFTVSEKGKTVLSCKLDDKDGTRNRTCYLTYDGYEDKRGVLFATRRSIQVSEKEQLDIKLDFKQYGFNETLTFPFSIPKNYKYE